jgi:NAD(P)-dependent dehydrogenase (short-subunit alcohol dehydrogenase family)
MRGNKGVAFSERATMPVTAGSLDGRVAIVTGGGRGIGRAICLALSQAGAAVAAAARTLDEISETVEMINAGGGRALGVVTDVADRDSVQALIAQTLANFDAIDILVNDAGMQGPIGPLVDNDWQAWRRTIEVNLIGTFFCTQAVLPVMLARKRGKIINLSGGGATQSRPNFSAYGASKTAVVRLTETLAEELRDAHIDVNAIAPGAVNTRMLDEVLAAEEQAGSELINARQRAKIGGTPVAIPAALAVFLASPASDGLTGKLISAPHDDWYTWDDARITELMALPWLTLRRIDPHTLNSFITDMV